MIAILSLFVLNARGETQPSCRIEAVDPILLPPFAAAAEVKGPERESFNGQELNELIINECPLAFPILENVLQVDMKEPRVRKGLVEVLFEVALAVDSREKPERLLQAIEATSNELVKKRNIGRAVSKPQHSLRESYLLFLAQAATKLAVAKKRGLDNGVLAQLTQLVAATQLAPSKKQSLEEIFAPFNEALFNLDYQISKLPETK